MRAWPRTATAWVLVAVNVAVLGVVLVFSRTFSDFAAALLLASFVLVGGVLVLKLPKNTEAWLLLIIATAWSFAFVAPFDGSWVPPVGLMTTQLLLRFPDGSLPSPRWRWFSRATLGLIVVLSFVVTSADKVSEAGNTNDFYVSWAQWFGPLLLLLPLSMVVCAISLVVRYRSGRAAEREQIRWLAWASATVATIYIVTLSLSINSPWDNNSGTPLGLLQTGALLSFALIPLSIGVAVLRYRLYDIDRIISRTTSYAVVTGLVLVTYVAVVTLGTRLLPGSSSLAVAAATLAAAAVFRPLLNHVQASVDKRFNRERYNAVLAVDAFSQQLRDVVDTTSVADILLDTVRGTLEPSQASLWLRDTDR